ncbi:NAD(P)H-dependent glycerol-3-phosphate dehydrogenase [Gulosibacter molinativorax]|uniref:Glycerol-3-phosphate dehydrogenase [NAD(P)+] n=1 Tax=Gulosibacter molinativorax TaxID=256821 RepID=A0ABT7C8N2_9MICO|nr:NAD(P)H-dependent glycerol-3-phosphate dehydrogenase [Gulosibacter molinativorax]MDJ1371515.1 NAD(P)-dependent glycerol-3-phosphate dehydrogenase [Gulosibacter molinativorax]QUY62457.1 Glycerol-3-phosphate dehydrogenase [NAD(P)+] [Gulosibacter molinativorax]
MSEWYPATTPITLPTLVGSESATEGERIVVIGGGNWGTTFAKIVADGGRNVTLVVRRPELVEEINGAHRNTLYLPGINLPERIVATDDLAAAISGADLIFISVPAQSARENIEEFREFLKPGASIVSLMKGVERSTGKRMSEVIADVSGIGADHIAVASGPNIALEIAREEPTAIVVASESEDLAVRVAQVARNSYLRSFVNQDVIGTEFGGVLKNLIAIAIGIADGVGYGENTKASIMTRGLAEITDFAVAMGASRETMMGLAGMGDLIATCMSPLSRNFTAGRLLGQGYSYQDVNSRMEQTAEGLRSVDSIRELAEERGVPMPIVQQIAAVLEGRMRPVDLAPHLATDNEIPRGE